MRDVFQQQLELLDSQLLVMASSMQEAVAASIRVMEERDADLAAKVIEGDDDLDRQEREIESLCLKLLLTQQPVAGDLRRVSAGLKMVGDLERIGDQAADICETMAALEGDLDVRVAQRLRRMGESACTMVHEAVEAFVAHDLEKARAVIGRDGAIDVLFDEVKAEIVAAIHENPDPASALVDALMAAKYLERIGNHAQNVAEWVEYSLTGYYKGDLIG